MAQIADNSGMGGALAIVVAAAWVSLWGCAQGSDRSSSAPGSAGPVEKYTGTETTTGQDTSTETPTGSDAATDTSTTSDTGTDTKADPDSFPREATDCKTPMTVNNTASFKPDCKYVQIFEDNHLILRLKGPARDGKTGTLEISYHSEEGKWPEIGRTYTGSDLNPSGERVLNADYVEFKGSDGNYGTPVSGSAKFTKFNPKQDESFTVQFDLTVTTADDLQQTLTFTGTITGKIP